jgi:hypothetical protein
MYQNYFILEWHCTRFGRSFRPSSGVQNCTYSSICLTNACCSIHSLELLTMDGETVQNKQCRSTGASSWFYYRASSLCLLLSFGTLLSTTLFIKTFPRPPENYVVLVYHYHYTLSCTKIVSLPCKCDVLWHKVFKTILLLNVQFKK